MKVIIVGASYTGIQLAKPLADEKSDVVLSLALAPAKAVRRVVDHAET